jgi:AraC-like DNA-binding protein
MVSGTPAPPLRPFVDHYVGYRMSGFPPGLHRGVPSRYMTFIVSVGPGIDVVQQTNPSQDPRSYGCVLSGLQATPALIAHSGRQEGVEIELTPLGCRTLFGMPASELWDASVELEEVIGRAGTELWEQLQTITGWEERFAACDRALLRLAGDDEVAPELRHCWSTLVGSGGRMSVGVLAGETGYSRQNLTRRFRHEFGLGPKLAARVMRFERARRMLDVLPPGGSIASIAGACGYYDQAHLNRDFTDLAGCTPTELLAENVPFVQDGALDRV